MSHFSSVKTQITDEKALIKALKAIGLNPIIHQEKKLLNNYWKTKDYAEIIIPSEQLGCRADVGFSRTTEGFAYIADDYEIRRSKFPELNYNVAVEYQAAIATAKGYEVVGRQTTTDGRIQLKLQVQVQQNRRR